MTAQTHAGNIDTSNGWLGRGLRAALAWAVAVVATVVSAVALQTQNLIARLNGLEAEIGLGERVSMTLYDILHLGSVYIAFIAVALLAAFVAAAIVYRLAGFGRVLVFAVAGAVAMLVMLVLMKQAFFGVQLIAGARDAVGFWMQAVAGGLGGVVFAAISRPRRNI